MTRRVAGTTLRALILAGLALFGALAVLVVVRGEVIEDDGEATTLLLSGRAAVPRGQIQDDVMVLRGSVVVDGTVEDDVLVVDGRARIEGVVHGDVVVLSGDAVLGRRAEVGGDVRTSGTPRIAEGAAVGGAVTGTGLLEAAGLVPGGAWLGLWLSAGLSVLAAGLVGSPSLAGASQRGLDRPGRSLLLGGAALAGAGVAIGVLALSVVGGLLALVLAAAALLAATAGAAASAGAIGRLLVPRLGRAAFLAGWLVLGVALGLALVASPFVTAAAAALVVAHGIGSLLPAPVRPTVAAEPVTEVEEPEPAPVPAAEDEHDPGDARVLAAFPIGSGPATPN